MTRQFGVADADGIILPSGECPIPESAETIFALLAGTDRFYRRGSEIVEQVGGTLERIDAQAFRSRLQSLGKKTLKPNIHSGLCWFAS